MLASHMLFRLNAQNSSEMYFVVELFLPRYLVCVLVHVYIVYVYVQGTCLEVRRQPKELVLSYHVGPEDETQVL